MVSLSAWSDTERKTPSSRMVSKARSTTSCAHARRRCRNTDTAALPPGACSSLADVEGDALARDQPPDPVAPVAALLRRLLDEAVLRELAQVEAGLVGRDPEVPGDVGGAQRAAGGQLAEDPVARGVGDRAQHARVVHRLAARVPGAMGDPTEFRTHYCATSYCAIYVAHM